MTDKMIHTNNSQYDPIQIWEDLRRTTGLINTQWIGTQPMLDNTLNLKNESAENILCPKSTFGAWSERQDLQEQIDMIFPKSTFDAWSERQDLQEQIDTLEYDLTSTRKKNQKLEQRNSALKNDLTSTRKKNQKQSKKYRKENAELKRRIGKIYPFSDNTRSWVGYN